MSKRRVAYFHDLDVGCYTYGLGHPMKPHRIGMAHELIAAYDMLPKMQVIKPPRCSPEQMTAFHTDEYIQFLNRVTPETVHELSYGGTRFLVGDDNPAFDGVFEFCSISAGGSLAASNALTSNAADIAINWAGGLHHAKKREASGFCYINDIVLAILDLLRTHPRVLYIDIDCHHGDGVEEAFYTTDRVMTCSFHKFGDYFPGTGTQKDKGRGKGLGYAVNVPLKDGLRDDAFQRVFEPIVAEILKVYRPSVVVLQCGADSLSGDKLGCFNLSMRGHANCVQFMRKQNIPLILLGGGGYTVKNVARAWCYETACAIGIEQDIDIDRMPYNEYFEWFGPRYRLEVATTNAEDENFDLEDIKQKALKQISGLVAAPSVQMHDVPRQSVGEHVGLTSAHKDDVHARDDLDERLAQAARLAYSLRPTDDHTSDSELSDSSASTTSRSRNVHRRKRFKPTSKHMSILTNQFSDVSLDGPPVCDWEYDNWCAGAGLAIWSMDQGSVKRRFFSDVPRWERRVELMKVGGDSGLPGVLVADRPRIMEPRIPQQEEDFPIVDSIG